MGEETVSEAIMDGVNIEQMKKPTCPRCGGILMLTTDDEYDIYSCHNCELGFRKIDEETGIGIWLKDIEG